MKTNLFAEKFSQTKIKSLGVSLTTYYCGNRLAYKMYVGGKLLFKGDDFKPSPLYDWDSLEANLSLLGFLSCGIHDVESNYFKDYTPAQLEWAKGYAIREDLTLYLNDMEDTDSEYHEEAKKHFKHTYC